VSRALRLVVLLALALAFAPAAFAAVEPHEMLKDPAQEARAREIGRTLRCVVCQNQSIDDSSADIAKDMRRRVREQISAGATDAQVYADMRARYGDFVLLKPPFGAATIILWLGPLVALGIAAVALGLKVRRRKAAVVGSSTTAAPLSDAERARLAALTRDDAP
jgi:cytochrome c-type biogenesis protein CcmH